MIAVANNDHINSQLDHLQQHIHPDSGLEWTETWQRFHENSWFKNRLEHSARRVIKKTGFPMEWKDDVKQEALILFAHALRRNRTLGFDDQRGNLSGFLSTIIYRCCQKGLRQFRHSFHNPVGLDLHPSTETDTLDEQMDIDEGIQKLEEPYQTTIGHILAGKSISEIAKMAGCSERTIYRRLEKAISLLRSLLDPA